jgi:cytochrome c556
MSARVRASVQRRASVRALAAIVSAVGALAIAAAQTQGGGTRVAQAQGAGAAEVINARQQGFKKLGAAFKLIHNELASPSPDAAKIASAAQELKASTDAIGSWFPPGSGPQPGLKTHAKAEIWTDASGFAATRAAFVRQVEKAARQLADPRERAAWKDSSAALGQACKDCHDSYRVKG